MTASAGLWTVTGLIAVSVLGYLFDRLEQHLKTIAGAVISIQSDIEAVRSAADAMSTDLNVLRTQLLKRDDQ